MQLIGFHPNGLLPNEVASVTRPLDRKRWARAEEIAAELISHIQPNVASEKHRNAVASYVQRLITNCMPCQVVTFGSVPLKTYLPDGDIDLTAFSEDHNLKDKWADEVRDMLEKEEKNEEAEFQVKEVHYIQAEVKIIKCLIDNIVVDISFNQLGGLCTLCFLEEVDNLINQNHLFKRSIILVKAWCYYESRILGAHHGLISTYALETLVLYIFHVFNNSFTGPLEVLYRFLEFFSKFDWANYCVSLWGPVPTRSLPVLAAIPPRNDGGELLLDDLFLSACSRAYSVFPSGLENQEQAFISKHFNIVDPLRIANNLGRSVSKGNFYRIRSAFSLGAQKLGRILQCQEESVAAEVNQIFVNTWSRHSKGCRPDAPVIDVSHDPDVSQSHHFLESAFRSGNFPLSHTMRNISATHNYDTTSYQEASGWGHCYPWRSYINSEHNKGEQTCRMDMLQNRGCPMPQFSRTFSSPELTNMSKKHGLLKHNVGAEKMEVDADSISIVNHVAKYSTDELHTRDNLCDHNPYPAYHPNNFFRDYSGNPVIDITKSVTSAEERGQSNVVRDFINPVSSSGIENHDGNVQGYFNGAYHPLIPISSQVLEYSHRDFDGTNPSMLTSLGSDCGTIMHYCNGLFPVPASQDLGGRQDNHSVFWTVGDANSVRETDLLSDEFSTACSILSPPSPATSSRTKASSECSWDEKLSSSGNRTTDSLNTTSNVHSECQVTGEFASDVNDNYLNWFTSSTAEAAITSSHAEVHQLPGYGAFVTDYYHSMSSFSPLLLHPSSEHGVTYNHGAFPVTFYPTGSPLPFITMMPLCNMYAERTPASTYQLNVETENSKFSASESGSDVGMDFKLLSHLDNHDSVQRNISGEHSDKIVPDIFKSDFASHWKNLQYGRLCRSSQLQDPFLYSPVVGAPQNFPEHLPFYSPKRPSPVSADAFSHLEPVSAPQLGYGNPVGFSRQYEVSKHCNGTGTYFPEPKISQERQCSASRQSHVDQYQNRNEHHGDKEANYNFELKTRLADCSQARCHNEKPNIKMGNSAHTSQTQETFQHSRDCLQRFSEGPFTPKSAHKGFKKVDYTMHHMQSAHHNEVSPKKHPRVKMCTCSKNISCSSLIKELQFGSIQPDSFVDVGYVPEPHGGYKRGGNHDQ